MFAQIGQSVLDEDFIQLSSANAKLKHWSIDFFNEISVVLVCQD